MNKQKLLATLTPEIIEKFRTAIEIGKWADGRKLTHEQRETCMQSVMIWEHEYLPIEQRIGFIHKPVAKNENMIGSECHVEHDQHYPNLPNTSGLIQPINFKTKH